MTLDELIEQLQEIRDTQVDGGSIEVRIAFQPNYPLAADIATVTFLDGDPDDRCDSHAQDEWCEDCEPEENEQFIWIAATDTVRRSESPYAPRAAWGSDW